MNDAMIHLGTRSKSKRTWRAALETVLLTAAVPAVGLAIDRHDPLFLSYRFSSLLVVPLLVALRHGFALACTSAMILDAALVVGWRAHALGVAGFPGQEALGTLALAMLTGQFSDVWRRETKQLEETVDAHVRRVRELERTCALVSLSHDRLDDQHRGAPNLREALAEVRAAADASSRSSSQLAPAMMEIVATYCHVDAASLYAVDARGKLVSEPLATLGRPAAVADDDPLVRATLEAQKLTYLPASARAPDPGSRLIAAVPLVDTGGRVHGVLCIESIPFMAFHAKNLEAIATLAGYFADLVATAPTARGPSFEERVARALRDLETFGIAAGIAAIALKRDGAAIAIVEAIVGGTLRDVDVASVTRDAYGNYLVYVLLPMADEAAARAFEARVSAVVKRELDLPLERAGAAIASRALTNHDTVPGAMRSVAQKVATYESALDVTRVG